MTIRTLAAAALVLLVGCSSGTAVTESTVVGAIGYPDNLDIEIPDTVQAGEAFTVSVRTLEPDDCWELSHTEAAVDGLLGAVLPHNSKRSDFATQCTPGTVEIVHTASLTFTQTGEAVVKVVGRDGTADLPVTVE